MKIPRKLISVLVFGQIWWALIILFFIVSGAQQFLGNPEYQSEKFIQVFAVLEPLPRMALSPWFIWVGMFVVGLFPATVFLYLNKLLPGNWWQRGLKYGLIHWALITPWFEFYLPYNTMHEPFILVLLECVLWFFVAVSLGLIISFIVNFKADASNQGIENTEHPVTDDLK